MKQFLYFTIFFASIGTIVLIISNPKLVQQGVSYLGITPAGSHESSSNRPEDDHLEKFLSHYSGEKRTSPEPLYSAPSSEKPETIIIPTPPIPSNLSVSPVLSQLEPLPKVESLQTKPLQTKPLQAEPIQAEPTQAELLKSEPPKPELPQVEPEQPVLSATASVTPAANPLEIPENAGAGFASSRHGAVPAAAIESLEQWSEPPIIPNKNEPPLPVGTSLPETIPPFDPPTTPPFPFPVNPPPNPQPSLPSSPQTGNDPFLQTLNSQSVPAAAVPAGTVPADSESPVPFSVSQNEIQNGILQNGTQPIISTPPVRSVYDIHPLPTPSLPQQGQPPIEPSPVIQPTSLSIPQEKVGSQFQGSQGSQLQIDPSVMVEEVPCYGTETVARVGTQVILMCDLLPQLRRAALQVLNENLKRASDEERAQVSEQDKENFINMFVENQYPAFLQEQIIVALVFNDYLLAKSREEREMLDKRFGEEFDQHEIPVLIKEFGVRNNIDLKQYLKDKLGSSLDRERMLWIRSKIAQQWILFNMQDASGECTHDEMMEFYTKHKDQFTSELRVQWQELFAAFSNHPTEEAARNKVAWMGNQVVAGYSFEEIAKVNSEGFTASKGGFWDWTKTGSLTSPELEQAVFSLPVNKMSSVIRSDKGFHIIRVVKREEAETVPFIEAQVTIRERIKTERRQKLQSDYFAELKKRYPARILRERIDFNLNN
ncbi:MAG: peptidylprolyl isomerase [Planctomycetaceae bacterium]|nr:peptidylprolyl isomerase [Planctomycetaceae bacterium]